MLRTSRKASSSNPNLPGNAHTGPLPASPAMRRRRKETECQLKLERVLGLTTNKPMVLSVNSAQDLVAYAAGCVVVLYNHKLDKQVGLLCSSTLTSSVVAVSSSAVATGAGSGSGAAGGTGQGHRAVSGISSLGGSPRANTAQWMNSAMASANINPLAGLMPMAVSDGAIPSSFGASNPSSNKNIKPKPISCLSFSQDGQFLAIGETGHQPRILIWDVATQTLAGELQGHKFGVQAVQFSPNSRHLVSLGFQHDGYIHVWNWRTGAQIASNKVTTKVNALAFSADGAFFVTAGLRHIKFWYLNVGPSKRGGLSGSSPNTQVLDGRSGILGDLRHGNYVDAACSQDGRFTYAITSNGVLCLFTEGRVMEKWIDLHTRGAYSINLDVRAVICACTDGVIRLFEPETLQYIATLPKPSPVGAFAGTMSMDILEEDAPNSVYADVLASQYDASSGCLICVYSDRSLLVWNISDSTNAILTRSHLFHSDCVWGAEVIPTSEDKTATHPFPADTFITYSADGSIKFWNLDENISVLTPTSSADGKNATSVQPSKEILRVLYVDDNCKSWIQAPENQDGMEPGFNIVPLECGIRTVRVSPGGRYLASGDKGGNLRVHDLSTLERVTYQEAHDTEILAIDFTDPVSKDSPFLVATAGRDRLLHVFDILNDYALVQTLDDHSSSITCIRFTADGSRMMSCGADKSIIFRNSQRSVDGLSFQPYHQAPGRATFYDMGMDDASQTISVVSGDRRFNIFALDTGKAIKSFKAETKGDDLTAGMAEICSMTHISLDPTGTIAAASGSDKSIRIYDLIHGTCLAHTICHSELVTSVKFMGSYDRIVSTSADGCVLVWRLSKDIVRRILTRVQDNITLPAYLKTKAVEKLLTPNVTMALPSPRPLRLKSSIDRLGAHASENSGTSRRNSTTSIMSEDCEVRSEDNSDDWNEHRRCAAPKGPRKDGASKESFAPVTVNPTVKARVPGSRSRVTGSISKSPLTRSRQNSISHPAPTSKSQPSSARSSGPQEQPPWNRNVVKERIPVSPSFVKTAGVVAPRARGPTVPAVGKLLTPGNLRPRATSLTVPTEATLKLDGVKAKSVPAQRRSLSDYARDDPPTAPGDEDDDVLSDDTESGFDDGLEFVPQSDLAVGGSSKATVAPDVATKHSNIALTVKTHARARTTNDGAISQTHGVHQSCQAQEMPEAGQVASDIDTGASEERDGDDEHADEDESISGTGSENDVVSPLQRRNVGPGGDFDGILAGGDSVTFEEGETMKDSPKSERSYHATSPSGRVTSMRPAGIGRRSLSSRFLTAHAAAVMMGLAQSAREEGVAGDGAGNELLDGQHDGSVLVTPRVLDDRDQMDPSLGATATAHIDGSNSLLEQNRQDRPLEERLNLQSLNAAAMKWKQRSLGGAPSAPTPSDSQAQHGQQETKLASYGEGRTNVKSEDYFKEMQRTRKRLAELGYITTPGGTQQASPSVMSASPEEILKEKPVDGKEGAEKSGVTLTTALHLSTRPSNQQSLGGGVLASPVAVNSPEGMRQGHLVGGTGGMAWSLDQALDMQTESDCSAKTALKEQTKYDARPHRLDNEQSLRDAFDRISFLISHKALIATRSADASAGDQNGVEAATEERVQETKRWMMETREGLLNLVGEVQGHLWTMERSCARSE